MWPLIVIAAIPVVILSLCVAHDIDFITGVLMACFGSIAIIVATFMTLVVSFG